MHSWPEELPVLGHSFSALQAPESTKRIRLLLVRHGESHANTKSEHYVSGRSSFTPLTEKGKEQAAKLGQRWKRAELRLDGAFASTAVRAKETAQIVCSTIGIDLDENEIPTSYELEEISQGEWEGKLRHECYTHEVRAKIDENPWEFKPPGGESQREVEERIVRYVESRFLELHEKHKEKEELTVAVFGHGLAFKCLLRNILNSSSSKTWTIQLDNTSVSEFEYDHRLQAWRLIRWNDTAHLEFGSHL